MQSGLQSVLNCVAMHWHKIGTNSSRPTMIPLPHSCISCSRGSCPRDDSAMPCAGQAPPPHARLGHVMHWHGSGGGRRQPKAPAENLCAPVVNSLQIHTYRRRSHGGGATGRRRWGLQGLVTVGGGWAESVGIGAESAVMLLASARCGRGKSKAVRATRAR